MRAIWKGAVSFGLVNVPVKLFAATQEHDIRFHQVHRADGGRIRMRRVCSVCGEEVAYDQLARGFESPDGRLVVLDDEDFVNLPLATGKEIDVVEFVPSDQVDPILLNRTYYLEPEVRAVKPYALLREALVATDRMAVVKVALRQRESMAVLRVRDGVIVLQSLLWPDEVRTARFDTLDGEVELRPQELAMAESLVESLTADFEPDRFEDRYATALTAMVEAKLAGAPPAPTPGTAPAGTEMVDLLTALQHSVERARAARGETRPGEAPVDDATTTADDATTTAEMDTATAEKRPSFEPEATKATARKASQTPAARKTTRKTSTRKTSGKKAAHPKSA